jgi:MYXO-CTERM domain-containing protein
LTSFNVLVGNVGPGQTFFNVIKPPMQPVVGPQPYFNASSDDVASNIDSNDQKGAYTGSTGITLYTPEPAGIGLAAAAVATLCTRRRRRDEYRIGLS